MELEDRDLIFLELKYCERCGGLWLRMAGSEDTYCASCAIEMLELARPVRRKYGPRLAANHKIEANSLNNYFSPGMISSEGGHA